jgi:hypothetical protein
MTWNSHHPSDTAAEEEVAVEPLQAPYAVAPELGVFRGTAPEVEDNHLQAFEIQDNEMQLQGNSWCTQNEFKTRPVVMCNSWLAKVAPCMDCQRPAKAGVASSIIQYLAELVGGADCVLRSLPALPDHGVVCRLSLKLDDHHWGGLDGGRGRCDRDLHACMGTSDQLQSAEALQHVELGLQQLCAG